MVRLYRGLNLREGKDSPASIMNQIPYALRSLDSNGHLTEMKAADQEVKNLAENPTYENLIAYTDKVRPLLKNNLDVERLDAYVAKVEENLLEGYSVRNSQIRNQYSYNGGSPVHSASPYISVSPNTEWPSGYGFDALMVLDVPLSEVEDYKLFTEEGSTETAIKGKLDKKYISAILSRADGAKDSHERGQELADDAVTKVDSILDVPHLEGKELQNKLNEQIEDRNSKDEIQKEKDTEMVVTKRLNALARRHREFDMENVSVDLSENALERYKSTKDKIFDHYVDRLSKLENYGRDANNISMESYRDEYGNQTHFDKTKVDERMLAKLRNLTEAQEEKYEDFKNRRARKAQRSQETGSNK